MPGDLRSGVGVLAHQSLDGESGGLPAQLQGDMGQETQQTFLYINGLATDRNIDLAKGIQLQPASMSIDPSGLTQPTMDELAIVTLFLPKVESQLRVEGEPGEDLAARGWNALWDVVLLAALLKADCICNLFGSCSATDVSDGTEVQVSNHHLYGFGATSTAVSEEDADWLGAHYPAALALLDESPFGDAASALWSYKWHTQPRAQLALLWSGIEGLFSVQAEVTFRVSLAVAHFLEPDDRHRRAELFDEVKRLYGHRSRAVHGGKLKDATRDAVSASAELLQSLLRRCAEAEGLPQERELVL